MKKGKGKTRKMLGPQRFMKGEGKHSLNLENGFQTKESKKGGRNKRGKLKRG